MGNIMKIKFQNQSCISKGLLLCALSVGLLASSACQQDPFADKSEKIRHGVPPELLRDPPAEKARSKDALHIDSMEFYSFHEQVESEITLSGRVLEPGATFTLSIDNKKDFDGAVFDATTGSFKWAPKRGVTGGDYQKELRMIVRLTSKDPKTGALEGTTKEIPIFVTRSELDPQIMSIDDITTLPTREGELRKFNVIVKDPDAVDADGKRPRINAIPSKKGPLDISGLVTMQDADPNPVQDPTNKQQWIFKMQLDLQVPPDKRGRDFTRTQETFKFGLLAVSQFGRSSAKDFDASIITDVMKPDASWVDPITAVAGQENLIQFTVFDPYAEGALFVEFTTRIDQLPGVGISKCKTSSREGNVLCQISWKPLATTTGDIPITFEATNKSKVPGDIKFIKEVFTKTIHVIPGQPPIATPTPVPPATPTPAAPTPVPAHPGPHSTSSGGAK